MPVYSTRAEWLESKSRDHFNKLGSLTIKTTNAHFMGKFAAHEFSPEITKTANFNAVLLDIIERSKPNVLIKSAALRATLNDEGILKVASEDSYWASTRGSCHLSFLSGVWDVDPDMAWTFAKNAGLDKEAGIVGGIGKLFGTMARGGAAVGRGVATGARAVGSTAQKGWQAGKEGIGAARGWLSGSTTGGLNPFQRAATRMKGVEDATRQRAGALWRGQGPGTQMELPGMESAASNPFTRAGQSVAQKARSGWQGMKQQLAEGYQAGRAPAPAGRQLSLQFGNAPRQVPATGTAGRVATRTPVTASGGAGAAGRAAPQQAEMFGEAGVGAAGHVAPPAGAPVGAPPPTPGATPSAGAGATAPNVPVTPPTTPPAPPGGAGAAGQVVPKQSAGREAWEATKSFGRGARNLGYAGIVGGTVLGAAGLSAAGNLVRPNPSPYQYGMSGPASWMSPQQM